MSSDEPTQPEPVLQPLLIPAERVAELLSLSHRTVRKLDVTEQIPAPVRIGRRVLWSVAVIEAWVAAGCPARHRWEASQAAPAQSVGKQRGRR